jgi:two-component sensor histidine kinase
MKLKTSGAGGIEFCLVLTRTLGAAIRAREAVLRRFGTLPEDTREDLAAVVAELVQNSADYGPGGPIFVTVVVGGDAIRGEVSGHAPAVGPPRISDREKSDAGGLAVVDRVSSRWAVVEGTADVWFEMPLRG